MIAESALQSKALGDENNFFAACAAELRLAVGEQTAEIAASAWRKLEVHGIGGRGMESVA